MEYKHINLLLEKYWAGETSLEEETRLRDYFQEGPVAEEHRAFTPLFQFFSEAQEEEVSTDFDDKLLQQLAKQVPEVPQRPALKVRSSSNRLFFYVSRAAAVLALVLSMWFLFYPSLEEKELAQLEKQEIEEAKLVYEQAKAALMTLSKKMNKGTATVNDGMLKLEETTQIINPE